MIHIFISLDSKELCKKMHSHGFRNFPYPQILFYSLGWGQNEKVTIEVSFWVLCCDSRLGLAKQSTGECMYNCVLELLSRLHSRRLCVSLLTYLNFMGFEKFLFHPVLFYKDSPRSFLYREISLKQENSCLHRVEF